MAKYVVVSYDDDQQQWFDDTVEAEDSESAIAFVLALRPYVISARTFAQEDIEYLTAVMARPVDFDASETLSECQNCEAINPASKLRPIEDIHQRVEPGEPMPSGECPECGALCHELEPANG